MTPTKNKFEIADDLASKFAEDCVVSECIDMMIVDGSKIAKAIRHNSESNIDVASRNVQTFRANQRAIYSALWYLLDGKYGYKLVPIEKDAP